MANHRLEKEWNIMMMVWKAASGQHARMSLALLLELAIGLFPPGAVYLLQHAAGANVGKIEALFTSENIIYALAIYFIYILLTKVTRVLTAYAVAEVEYGLRNQFSQSLTRMPFTKVMRTLGMKTSNALTQEIAMASSLIPIMYKSFIRGGTTIVAFCVLLIILSIKFFLIVIALTGIVILSVVTLRSRLKKTYRQLYNEISSLHQLFAEWISGYRVFRVYTCMGFAIQRMQRVFLDIRNISRRLTVISNSQSAFAEMLTYSMAAIIILLMPNENGIINISMLISYPAAILFIRGELLGIINGYQQLATTESSVSRLYDVLFDSPDTQNNYEGAINLKDVTGIAFDNVCYSYRDGEKEREILRDTDISLKTGFLNVITGPSGRGKTTTLNLILGLIEPDRGRIILEYGAPSDKSGVALVEQEPYLFDGTLYENICMGRKDITEESILALLESLELSEIFPDKKSLHNIISKFDTRMSSGEKQRIALIRALVGNPSVLVADEITSNVDATTTDIIIKYLKRLSTQILVIIVSHDKTVIDASTSLYVLENKHFNMLSK